MKNEQNVKQITICHIRVIESLDDKWSDWFGDFIVTPIEGGSTILSGEANDQSVLLGVLEKIHSLGLSFNLVLLKTCPNLNEKCFLRGYSLKWFKDQNPLDALLNCINLTSDCNGWD